MKRTYLAIIVFALFAAIGSRAQDEKPVVQTEIESIRLQVQNDGENAYFHFNGFVVLTATNMRLECDDLEVFASREAEADGQIGKFGAIKKIIATGHVRIIQEERTATSEKAVVEPNEERIVLTGNAVIEQAGFSFEGKEIILNRFNGTINIDGDLTRKIHLTGPAIGDLGFEEKSPVPTAEDSVDETNTNSEETESASATDEEGNPDQ